MHFSVSRGKLSDGQSLSNAIKSAFRWLTLLSVILFPISHVTHADIGAAHSSLVSEFASFNTPGVVDGRVEAIAIDGDKVFVGGTFTQIHDPLSDEIIDQPYLFAYSKSTGDIFRDFDPILNNDVLALETTGDGTGIFAAGVFNIINGESNRRGIVKLNDNGDRVSGFGARADATIKTLVRLNNKLYLGGNFSSISNTPVEHLAAIDTTTGAVLADINLDFDGVISTPRTPNGRQGVDDIDITSDGRLMVIFGNFSIIDTISRPRLALIELEGQAAVSTWNTDIFDPQCASLWPVQIRGVDIAPDDSYFVVGTSGARQNLNPACDTITRFEIDDLTNTDVQPTWINFTGGDSVFEVVATDHAIYAGGHFRWLSNFNSVNASSGGPGSTDRLGLAAFDPLNGLTLRDWRSDRNPRGVGTFALIAEPEGLYIGDDTDFLNGTEHKKLKFLPISPDTIARPDSPSLPTTIVSPDGNALDSASFDGTNLGAPVELANTGWGDSRGGVFVGGQLFHADNNGTLWRSQLTDGVFQARVPVDLFGLTEQHWALSQIGGMFFDYEFSRVYYTIQGDSQLLYRAFTPDGTYFGDVEAVAEQQGDVLWGDVSGMDVIDGYLYFARNNGTLYRAEIDGAAVISGTTEEISGPAIDGRNWDNNLLAFLGESTVIGGGGGQLEFESSGDSAGTGRFRKFEFPVTAGEPVVLRLEWLDPTAQLRLFVRDADNNRVVSDTTAAGSPKFLTVPAGEGGIYTASVLVAVGSTSYTLAVDPEEGPPEPLAEFEFSSSGSADVGSWQVFKFDVEAGELVEAQVIWDDPTAEVNLFVRDETNSSIVQDTDGSGSPAMASTIAATSGRWSVGVKVKSGAVNYDVLVDTTAEEVPVTAAITSQPLSATVDEGDDATFAVTATGSGTLLYQWFADGTEILDATSNILTLNAVTAGDSGTLYSVNVTDDNGTIGSDSAILTVQATPVVTNIALTGVASQSSTGFNGVPSRAIDGNTNGSYSNNSVTHTNNSNQPWWEVQLSELSTIETIIVYNRTDNCCVSRLSNFSVSVLDDNGQTVFSSNFSDAPDPSISIDIGGVAGSTVRVQLNGTNPLSLAEVQVLGYAQ